MSVRPGGLHSEIQESHSSSMKSGADQKGREVMKLGEEARKELEVDSRGGYDHKCYIHM